jgi:hypothetical protein
MNKLDVNQVGGFPLTTRILDELQKIPAVFNGLGGIAGDKTILYGCNVTGSTATDGVVFVNGEVFFFKGGIVQTKVIIKEDTENLVFENNESKTVIRTRYMQFGSGVGAMDWADFKKPFETKELEAALAGKTDLTTFEALADAFAIVYTKMLTIETGAQKNPTNVLRFLHQGTFNIGDTITTDSLLQINFPDIATSNYMVFGSLVSKSSNHVNDNDVIWVVREKNTSFFKLSLREVSNDIQNLDFEYMLIPKN